MHDLVLGSKFIYFDVRKKGSQVFGPLRPIRVYQPHDEPCLDPLLLEDVRKDHESGGQALLPIH